MRGRIASAPVECGLFLKRFRQRAVIAFLGLALSGCVGFIDAELNNRGGYTDQKLDQYWMVADTKQMRVLRAYLLIGSISRLPIETKFASERKSISDQINIAVNVANSAFVCAYSRPGECAYFDERMAELEISIIRLAVLVFTTKENEGLLSSISKAFNDNPAVQAVKLAGKIVDVAATGADFVANSGKLLASLLNFSEVAYVGGKRAGALYRDSLELGMVATISSLHYQCEIYRYETSGGVSNKVQSSPYGRRDGQAVESRRTAQQFFGNYSPVPKQSNWYSHLGGACALSVRGLDLYQRGSGDLQAWKLFLTTEIEAYRALIVPDENAFIQASDLIWRGCRQIADDPLMRSQCLGARPKHIGKECGCTDINSCPSLEDIVAINVKAKGDTDEGRKLAEANQKALFADKCPLLLYAKTRLSQQGRYGQSMARLYWLSPENPLLMED